MYDVLYNNTTLFWFGAFLNKNNQFCIFPGKIVTSFVHIFTLEKVIFKIIFCHEIFICQPIFRISATLLRNANR